MMEMKQTLFGGLDFESILSNRDFKEADVRANIIDPILKALGFTPENILREKALKSPFLRTGSRKRPVNLIPDYVLKSKTATRGCWTRRHRIKKLSTE
ncbi:MAG: hypothetical protein LBQ77_04985, partial [Treponema sp.]|nr:hypothetical protein [Treponema sp.]